MRPRARGPLLRACQHAMLTPRGAPLHDVRPPAGHIHWVWKFPAAYFAPNAYAYFLFGIAAVAARPLHVVSGPVGFYLVLFGCILLGFRFTMEAASVWCWTALGLHAYFIAQPYAIARFVHKVKPAGTTRVPWTSAAPNDTPA